MEAVVWFLVGALSSLVGMAAGTLHSGWVAWLGAVACGVAATALARRLPVLAGAAVVGSIAGARVAHDPRLAIVAALATVGALLGAPYGMARLRGARLPARPTSQSGAQPDPATGGVADNASPMLLTPARVASLVSLAAADTDAFRAEAAALSPGQRQQVREALLAAR